MDSKRLFYGLLGLLLLLIVGLFASVREADRQLNNRSHELSRVKAESQSIAKQKEQLAQDKKDILAYDELNEIAKSIVPQDKDQARAVREIAKLAAESGIPKLSSISFSPSTLGAAAAKSNNGLTQVTPVKGMPGVFSLQITVMQANTDLVPYSSFTTFLSKLEKNRRTAQVTSINVQPDQENPERVAFTLVINEYIRP